MQFAKGHTLSQGKRKLGGGRKKLPATIIKEMLEKDAQNLPAYLAKLGEKALEGDKEALKGAVKSLPQKEDLDFSIQEQLIVELYSK